ncbi:aldose 1-epimerase family protein [Leifsonia sp. SIMBA_070]|uniref:aldose 1-epimerase family protein n=1 Tax=Leifsonia sp. SIMBA_070 TaxID=3085810 RepID=UPI00397B07D2
MRPLTGDQYELDFGDLSATIVQVGAGIRSLRFAESDLTEPYPAGEQPPSACGIVLVPWPNRVADGRWEHDGQTRQLDLTEPAKRNAIHGLLRRRPYELVDRSDSTVTQAATIYPEPGYPYLLDTTVMHELHTEGLTVTHAVTNAGEDAAPVAIGAHPYLRIADVPPEQLTVTVAARTRFETDDRSNITGEAPVAGTAFDLSSGRRVSELDLDTGFADLPDGPVEHSLAADDGRKVVLWGDADFRYAQVFTNRKFATKPGGVALAIEPMTAPANALNSGRGLRWLEPGETWTVSWGIRPEGFGGEAYLASWG